MPERAYTVTELDALRQVVEHKWLFGRYTPYATRPGEITLGGRWWKAEEKILSVEAMVRTHMLAGHTAEDLLASEA